MAKKKLTDEASGRPINAGAEKWLQNPIKCLDFGFVYLVDYLGNDAAIAQAARVSYGKGTKKINDDEALIRFLMRHNHSGPFEMCELKFHAKMPIFVARQWIRHRTASINEVSGRYSEMPNEFYLPDVSQIRCQSKDNKQGRGGELDNVCKARVLGLLLESYKYQSCAYKEFLEMDLARELARIGLSVANYTEWYWKIDLRNLFNFLRLRLDKHAQYEIRVYAEAMARIVKDAFPIAYKAFEDYQLNPVMFSGPELKFLHLIRHRLQMRLDDMRKLALEHFKNERETEEFLEKIKKYFK